MKKWKIPMGRTHNRVIMHDFDLNPHMVIGGTTGFGKTKIIKHIMTALIESHPNDAKFFIIDMKGKLEFLRFQKLKQVEAVAGNAEEALVMLQFLEGVLYKLFDLFAQNLWTNITETPITERIFIIVDEGAQLIPESKNDKVKNGIKSILEKIAALGRAIGMKLIFATQYPTADALPRFIKQNTDVRICFRLADGYASAVVLGEGNYHAATLPTDIKGRCFYRTHEIVEMQTPLITDKEMWKRLKKYEELNTIREEAPTPGGDTIKFGHNEIRDKGTNTTKTQTRNRPKRPKNIKRDEGLPSSESPRGPKHLLPKRKGKGIGRGGE